METLGTKGQVLSNGMFVYPKDELMDETAVNAFINKNRGFTAKIYDRNMQYYLGKHDILKKTNATGIELNKIVDNIPKYLVDTYNGFFTGISPKITLDEDSLNENLQNWNRSNSFFDKLSEISKQVDIYGRSYAFIYQNESADTRVAVVPPTQCFIVYDDTIEHEPLAFVRYYKNSENLLQADIYYGNATQTYSEGKLLDLGLKSVYGMVPAVEFFENEERQGLYTDCISMIDALDDTLSQKQDTIEYFANEYMYVLGGGIDLNEEELSYMRTHRLINVPTANAADIKIGFLERPDGDNVQENQLQHLNDKIYQTTGIPNLSDSNFAGNASGVAIRYKLLAMENKASNKERKFTQALRALYKVAFSIDSVINVSDAWEDLKFKFTRNLPANLADEASTANSLNGIVSKETQLSALSIVDDPKAELQRMEDEQDQQLKKSLEVTGADYEKLDDTNQEQPEANQKSIKSPFSNEEVDND